MSKQHTFYWSHCIAASIRTPTGKSHTKFSTAFEKLFRMGARPVAGEQMDRRRWHRYDHLSPNRCCSKAFSPRPLMVMPAPYAASAPILTIKSPLSLLLQQLADCFTAMKAQHSWRGVKLDLYGLNGEQPAESGQRAAHPGAGDCRTRHQKNISAQPAPRPRHAPA